MAKLENKAKENPKLEQNTLSDGRISLYLEYYLGREETPVLDDNGNPVLYETGKMAVSYTHLTLPTTARRCRSRWSPYH